ncbi:MAG: hypothetical protein M3362_04870 [Acidobacteriota bacterium]|nr:hypothetical protein [Acidobacteriota bacterium]
MTNAAWSQLLGISGKPLPWERALLILAALWANDLVSLVIAPNWTKKAPDANYTLELFNTPSALDWLVTLSASFLLAALAVIAFFLVRNILAIVPLSIANGLIWVALPYLALLAYGATPALAWKYSFSVFNFINNILWALVFFGLLEIAIRVIKNLLLALLTGAVATSLMLLPVRFLLSKVLVDDGPSLDLQLLYLPFNVLGGLLFALALWAGIRFVSGLSLRESNFVRDTD